MIASRDPLGAGHKSSKGDDKLGSSGWTAGRIEDLGVDCNESYLD